ncbi:signal peptidase II [Abditibacterium utsteinense]|uniref:Lipoprotein signal peptidase n=1 Tax=Abditibacterium utsteinense TaxID=1960156 RepID=A0A2S8ST03_9BACT|nr:signal peptidase II [Abditibacterium utsteinense]PQV63931.1 signal peptidase II [Abditibacterium utsteinense]
MPLFFFAAILSLLADQLSKIWIRSRLTEGDSLDFLPGVMHLEHVQNHGAAWGVLSGQKWLLILFTLVVIGVIVRSARDVTRRGALASLGFGLILGGAVGNLCDRILFGHVTDFFDLDTSIGALQTFPVFNVADSALSVGVILMLLSFLLSRPDSPTQTSVSSL